MSFRSAIPVLAAFALTIPASGQGTPAKPACSTDPKATNPCPAPQPAPAQAFPYPGEASPATPTPATAPASQTASPPDSPAASPAKSFPYPGDAPPPPGNPGKAFPYPGDKTSGESSSSSSSSSSSDPDDPLDPSTNTPPPSSTGNTVRRKLPKPTHLQSDEEREAEDVKVAQFYSDSGNVLGAYNRLKDAVKLIHDDPDAFYLLGTVASRLGKQAESADAYKTFLELEPDTRRAKTLHQSLAQTQARK